MALSDVKPCGARTRYGGPCRQPAMRTNGRCRMHGGKTPSDLASPHLRHGRYSKDLPTRLLTRFEEALDDRELLSLRQDVALLDALITEKLAGIRDEESNLDPATHDRARAMREVRALVTEKAAVVAQENRRLAGLQQHLTVEEAMQAIAGEFREILSRRGE